MRQEKKRKETNSPRHHDGEEDGALLKIVLDEEETGNLLLDGVLNRLGLNERSRFRLGSSTVRSRVLNRDVAADVSFGLDVLFDGELVSGFLKRRRKDDAQCTGEA